MTSWSAFSEVENEWDDGRSDLGFKVFTKGFSSLELLA